MDIELQLQLAREYWKNSKGRPDIFMYPDGKLTPEEKLAIEELLRKGVLKRKKNSYFVCPETKNFIENNGKTSYEIGKEKEEKLRVKELELATESNRIAKRSQWISILSIIISAGVAIWVTTSGK
ncbi:MAG: hypothetical protein ACTH29_06180 [Fusobacterium sp.]